MLRFAVCDDNEHELARTMALLEEYQSVYSDCSFEAFSFQSIFEMMDEIDKNNFDAMFLDIYMPGITGMQAAKDLRQDGLICPIVFLTTSKEHALEAFGVKATQYLVKPYTKRAFFEAVDTILMQIQMERRRYILIKEKGTFKRVAVRDIVCCEARNNDQLIQLVDGSEFLVRMTLTELFSLLSVYPDFAHCGKAYIVNLIFVRSINHKQVVLQNGRSIFLPRGSYAPLKEQYFNYYGEGEELL